MTNLFSSFDPIVILFRFSLSANWLSAIIPIIILPQTFWRVNSQLIKFLERVIEYIKRELTAVFSTLIIPGTVFIYLRFFFFIFFCNFIGLFPYIFTSSRHTVFTYTMEFPIWLGRMLWTTKNQYNSFLAQLVPAGTPNVLIPIIVIIETVRRIIRPGTLSIRLAANIVAGHLLLTLLGSQGPSLSINIITILIVGLVLLLCLELAVACIQAYVFTILRSLYLNELRRVSFNKIII